MRHNYVLKKEHVTTEIVSHADEIMYDFVEGYFILYNRESGLWKEYNIHSKTPLLATAVNYTLGMKDLVKEPNSYNGFKTSAEICSFLNELNTVKFISITMMDDLGLKALEDGSVVIENDTDAIVDWNEVEDDENPFSGMPDVKDIPLKESTKKSEKPEKDNPGNDSEPNQDEAGTSDRLDKIYSDAQEYVNQVMADAKKAADDWKETYTNIEKEEKVIDTASLIIGIGIGAVGITIIEKAVKKFMD